MTRARDKANSTVTNFASTGIDDNADANAITIDSSENVTIASGNLNISTVGVIGIANGDNLFISSDDTNDVGVKFNGDGNRITPCDASGADRDNAIDLGEAGSSRFKDLHLGGGVYLGGTSSANLLDDYEEGTFTAGLAAGSGTITANTDHDLLSYIKIGNLVFISGLLIVGTFSGASNSLYITGLPFGSTAGSENSKLAAMSVAMQNLTSNTGVSLQAHVLADERILVEGFDGQTYNNIADHCGVGTQVRIGGSYYTG